MRERQPFWIVALGFFVAWVALDRIAAWKESFRGEYGVSIALVIVTLVVLIAALVHRVRWQDAPRAVGLGRPAPAGNAVAIAVTIVLASFFPIMSVVEDTPFALRADAGWIALGVFAQAGIAEELIFRGYLFGMLSVERSFWRAAGLSMIPFFLVHLLLFTSQEPAIAAAATLLAIVSSFPLARMYELGGRTMWAPAVVHFAMQGFPKMLRELPSMQVMLLWMVVCAALPWITFLITPARASPRA